MLNWYSIANEAAYKSQRYALLVKAEGKENAAYVDSKGIPTIGIGFNLRARMHDVATVLLGSDWTATLESALLGAARRTYAASDHASLRTNLGRVLQSWHDTQDPDVPTTFRLSNDQIEAVLNTIAPDYDKKVNAWLAGIPNSDERSVLFSLAYNTKDGSTSLLGNGLRSAITRGDRSEAWWEIRYNSNGDKSGGIANRRYLEAERFHLFDSGEVTKAAALQVGGMYTAHRSQILEYEQTYSPATAAKQKADAGIEDIHHELQPAIEALKRAFGIDPALEYEELQVATSKTPNLQGDGSAYDKRTNDQDLLVGSNKVNRLEGGRGDDALIGEAGADILVGGIGKDWLDGGVGADRMEGGTDDDRFIVDNVGDTVIEKTGGGYDRMIVRSAVQTKAANVEELVVDKAVKGQVKVTSGDLTKISLSSAQDNFWLEIDRIVPDNRVSIVTGDGADVVKLSGKGVEFGERVNGTGYTVFFEFTDFSAADRIDLTSFGLVGMVQGEQTTAAQAGLFLMAPGSELHLSPPHADYPGFINPTSQWWMVDVGDNDPRPFGPALSGALTAQSFLI